MSSEQAERMEREVAEKRAQRVERAEASKPITHEAYQAVLAEQSARLKAMPGACPTCGIAGGMGFLREDVPIGHPDFGKAVPCPDCNLSRLPGLLRERSQLAGWLKDATFENYRQGRGNQAGLEAARAFAEAPLGWLTLWGTWGPGKTHLLAAIVNHLTAAGIAAVYFTLPDLLSELRKCLEPGGDITLTALFERVRRVRVLALDEADPDKVNLTSWARETIYRLLDARYRELDSLGTAFATNKEPVPGTGGDWGYIYSRMHDHRGVVVRVGGGDARPVDFDVERRDA